MLKWRWGEFDFLINRPATVGKGRKRQGLPQKAGR